MFLSLCFIDFGVSLSEISPLTTKYTFSTIRRVGVCSIVAKNIYLQRSNSQIRSCWCKTDCDLRRSVMETPKKRHSSFLINGREGISLSSNDISLSSNDISLSSNDISLSSNDISFRKNDISYRKNDISFRKNDISLSSKDISLRENDISLRENDNSWGAQRYIGDISRLLEQ